MKHLRHLLALLLIVLVAAPVSAAPPNVVILLSDDHAWTDYGFMGHDTIQTPRLDKFAAQSAVFTRGYVPNSLCRPSLATILTGKYPWQHGIVGNDPRPPADATKRPQTPEYFELRTKLVQQFEKNALLPALLKDKGYLTMQTGKWWEGHYSRGGFTEGMTHGDPTKGGRHGDEGLKIGRQTMQPVFDFVDEAVAKEKPFFLWYAPMLPHDPHTPPQRLLEKYKAKTDSIHVARYWAMVEWWDETCGRVLDHLEKKGVADNTIVVYLADNGWIQSIDKPGYAPRSKRSQYDGGLRTPIMVRWPGKVQPTRDDKTLAHSIDVMPTILAACGIAAKEELPGVNLLELCAADFKKADGRAAKRDIIFGDIHEHDQPAIGNPAPGTTHRWCIEKNYKLILPTEPDAGSPAAKAGAEPEVELYDVLADPFEKKNLAREKPQVVADLTKKIDAWWPGK